MCPSTGKCEIAPSNSCLERCLVPTLNRGDTVIMDSLPVHKVAGVRELIEAAAAMLRYPPKYSPALNPIE
jgi:transposase